MRGEDGTGETGHGIAIIGHAYFPGITGYQHPSGSRLQFPDVLAHRGLAQLESFSGPGEAERVSDGKEGAELNRIEHCSSWAGIA